MAPSDGTTAKITAATTSAEDEECREHDHAGCLGGTPASCTPLGHVRCQRRGKDQPKDDRCGDRRELPGDPEQDHAQRERDQHPPADRGQAHQPAGHERVDRSTRRRRARQPRSDASLAFVVIVSPPAARGGRRIFTMRATFRADCALASGSGRHSKRVIARRRIAPVNRAAGRLTLGARMTSAAARARSLREGRQQHAWYQLQEEDCTTPTRDPGDPGPGQVGTTPGARRQRRASGAPGASGGLARDPRDRLGARRVWQDHVPGPGRSAGATRGGVGFPRRP